MQAIPIYAMSIFKLPKKLCHNIGAAMATFWWNFGNKEKSIQWRKWEKMDTHKCCGGMGFRDLFAFNKALLSKQVWRLLSNPNSMVSSLLRCKYYKNGSVLEANLGTKLSFLWRSIRSSIPLVKEGIFWSIGNGCHTKIWDNKWILKPSSFQVQAPVQILNLEAYV